MKSSGLALMFILILDLLVFISSYAMSEVNNDYDALLGYEGTLYQKLDSGNKTYNLNNTAYDDMIPGAATIEGGANEGYTDIFSSISGWISGTASAVGTGFKMLINILNGPTNLLLLMNITGMLAFMIKAFWYALTVFFIVAFMFGRE
jgi:hypothetical protein